MTAFIFIDIVGVWHKERIVISVDLFRERGGNHEKKGAPNTEKRGAQPIILVQKRNK